MEKAEESSQSLLKDLSCAALIVAAGRGSRFGMPKLSLKLNGEYLLLWVLRAFAQNVIKNWRWIVVHPDPVDNHCLSEIDSMLPNMSLCWVPGGATRALSVRAGLEAIDPDAFPFVAIHDVARPLIHPDDIGSVLVRSDLNAGVCLGSWVRSSLRVVKGGLVKEPLSRTHTAALSTPQLFPTRTLQTLYNGTSFHPHAGDETALFPSTFPISFVEEKYSNPKITFPHDMELCRALARDR